MKKLLALILAACMMCSACCAIAGAEEAPITIRLMREEQTVWYPEGENMNDNVLMDFVQDKMNVKFETAWSADNGNYESTINMMIAANDLPDMFYASVGQMATLCEYGMIQPIGQYFDEYLLPEAQAEIHWNHDTALVGCSFDGEYYGFPITQDFMGDMPMLYVRQDWLDNLGLTFDPANFTMDDFMAMCDAFTNGDPDGNGENDTYAFGFDGDAVNSIRLKALAHGLGLRVNMWEQDEAGSAVFTDTQESIKPLLSLMQEMYAKGYIAPDYVSMSYWTEGTADLAAGKYGIFVGWFWSGLGAPQTAVKSDPSMNFTVYPCPRNPQGEYALQTDITTSQFLVVNSNFEHPELAVEYMQLWYDLWRGQYGEYYHGLNGNEYAQAQEDFKYYVPFWWDPPLKNLGISNKVMYALETKDESIISQDAEAYKMLPHITSYLAGEEDYYGFAQYYNFCQGDQLVEKYYGASDETRYTTNIASAIPLDADLSGTKALLKDLRTEYFNKIIMGEDLDATFAEYVEQWHATGGDELADYYTQWFAANGSLFQ